MGYWLNGPLDYGPCLTDFRWPQFLKPVEFMDPFNQSYPVEPVCSVGPSLWDDKGAGSVVELICFELARSINLPNA